METIGNMYALQPNASGIQSRFVPSNQQANFDQSRPIVSFVEPRTTAKKDNLAVNMSTTASLPNASTTASGSPISDMANQMREMNVELDAEGERKLAQVFSNLEQGKNNRRNRSDATTIHGHVPRLYVWRARRSMARKER